MTDAIGAAREAAVAVFAFRGAHDGPMAVPVTPYVDARADDSRREVGGRIIVTSTLAYIRKAELVRRDGRVAMLAGGAHITGDAEVFGDLSGDAFAARYLEQELAKYPPARGLVAIPEHRRVLSWYFGRAIIAISPRDVSPRLGGDRVTLVQVDADGYPSIVPLSGDGSQFEHAQPGAAVPLDGLAAGPALALIHEESADMASLRHVTLRGEVRDGMFHVAARAGTLSDGDEAAVDYAARERRAREVMKDWPTM
jgi:hypothetical protein